MIIANCLQQFLCRSRFSAMKPRKIILTVLVSAACLLLVLFLAFLTRRLESRRAVEDMTEALSGVLAERGEKGLLEFAGADPDKLFYEYEGVDVYNGERRAWDYSEEERRNMSVFSTAAPSVVRISVFQGMVRTGDGAGVVYSSDGYLLTDLHVLGDGDRFNVRFYDGEQLPAVLVGSDSLADLAVLKVEAEGLRPVRAGSSEDLTVGEQVYAIGHPFSYAWSFSKGLVSGKGRLVSGRPGMIQTDTSINPGNSGGPLLSSDGRMAGLVSSIYSPSGSSQGVAFALPAQAAFQAAADIIATGRTQHGWLDLEALEINPFIAELGSMPSQGGLLVSQVISGGEAERSGLRGGTRKVQYGGRVVYLGGDIITKVNGKSVHDAEDYSWELFLLKAGDTVTLTVQRGSRELEISVKLVERTEENIRWLIQ